VLACAYQLLCIISARAHHASPAGKGFEPSVVEKLQGQARSARAELRKSASLRAAKSPVSLLLLHLSAIELGLQSLPDPEQLAKVGKGFLQLLVGSAKFVRTFDPSECVPHPRFTNA
jgi:hypothetical protein